MKLNRLTTLSLLAMLAAAACSREKVQPADSDAADALLTPAQRELKKADDLKKRQQAFADSVLKTASSTRQIADKLGKNYQVGSVQLQDSLVKWVQRTPQCFKDGKAIDPYLAGTVTFRIHMSVIGSDNVTVQQGDWTSKAGTITEKCLTEQAMKWTFPMGLAKQGMYLLQVQFR
jgi:hypothetical protein